MDTPPDAPDKVTRARHKGDREKPLFGALPPNLLRVFASAYRTVYEDILTDLVDDLFRDGSGTVTYALVLSAIRETIEARHPGLDVRGDDGKPGADKGYVLYNGLTSSGWLVEAGLGPRRTVDFNPNARLLLNSLLDIKNGLTRSWGGEVLTVLTLIEGAMAAPKDRAENIRSAHRASRNFQHHLRTLTSHLADIEREILANADLSAVVGGFFEIFVGTYLIEDYKRLKSRTNPFRFRGAIVDRANAIREDAEMMETLAKAYHSQGRARSAKKGFETVYDELSDIMAVFSNINQSVQAVEAASQRLERKFINLIHFRERYDEDTIRQVTDLAARLAASALPPDHVLDVAVPVGQDIDVIVPDRELARRNRRGRRERVVVEHAPVDPAFRRYYDELLVFQNLMRVTDAQAAEYLARAMRGRQGATLSELPADTLEDALVLSQLRRLFVQGDGLVGGRFRGTLGDHLVETEWLALEAVTVVDEAAASAGEGERSWG